MTEEISKQKRRYRRVKTPFLTGIVCSNNTIITDRAAVINISSGGLAFESKTMFSPGDFVLFNFSSLTLNLSGTIKRVKRRVGSYLHVMEFSNISYFDKTMLSKLISRINT